MPEHEAFHYVHENNQLVRDSYFYTVRLISGRKLPAMLTFVSIPLIDNKGLERAVLTLHR